MLYIPENIIKEIFEHSIKELPNEACGYLAGSENSISKAYLLKNIDQSPDHFSFDPAEQFKTVKDARLNGIELIANFHSHPSTPARPSQEDIRLAYDPNILYIIVSLADTKPDIKAFRIVEGVVSQEEISIVA